MGTALCAGLVTVLLFGWLTLIWFDDRGDGPGGGAA